MASTVPTFRAIIVGDSGVGKSCSLIRFIDGEFREDHNATVGVEYGSKDLVVNDKNVRLQVWDTVRFKQAGQENYRAVTRSFYRNAHGILLMYDLTKQETFDSLDNWLQEIKSNAISDVVIFLVANMLDLAIEQRVVYKETAEEFVRKNNLAGFIETSAKTDENITPVSYIQAFERLSECLLAKPSVLAKTKKPDLAAQIQLRPTTSTHSVNLETSNGAPASKKGCC